MSNINRAKASEPRSGRRTEPAWVPIRSLAARHRSRIIDHLVALDPRSRYLRFGYPATDEQIARYVERIAFEHDEVFGIFNRRLELIAVAHLAHPLPPAGADAMSEFGVSVLEKARGRGLGHRLFRHAMLHARNRGIGTLYIHALSENAAMLKIARDAGAVVENAGTESEARLRLPPGSFASQLDQLAAAQAAELDYRLKFHTHTG